MKTIPLWDDNWGKLQVALMLLGAGREKEATTLLLQICADADAATAAKAIEALETLK